MNRSTAKMRILVIEDDRELNHYVTSMLSREGYAVDTVCDGLDGQHYAQNARYDAIVLDIGLPGKNGLELCRELRDYGVSVPILMISGRFSVDDRVRGLDSGADDYLVKPFSIKELCARLRALLRRDIPNKNGHLKIGDLMVDPATHTVTRDGKRIYLTSKEFALLVYMMRHTQHVITREMALEHVWDHEFNGSEKIVDTHISHLRHKIDDLYNVKLIETVHGRGYRIRNPDI
jgi:DNA-binding response OmpR family regulator